MHSALRFLALSSTRWGGSPGHPTRRCLSGGGPRCTPSFSLEYGGGLAGEEEARPAVSLRSETPPNPPLSGEVVLKRVCPLPGSSLSAWLPHPPVLSGGLRAGKQAKKEPGSEMCREGSSSSSSAVAHRGGCPGPPTTTWFQALALSHWSLEHSASPWVGRADCGCPNLHPLSSWGAGMRLWWTVWPP